MVAFYEKNKHFKFPYEVIISFCRHFKETIQKKKLPEEKIHGSGHWF